MITPDGKTLPVETRGYDHFARISHLKERGVGCVCTLRPEHRFGRLNECVAPGPRRAGSACFRPQRVLRF